MGWKTGAATGAAAEMFGGPIGAAIGAGLGAFIGSLCEDQTDEDADQSVSIYLTEEGLMFPIAGITINWNEVVEIEFDNDDGNDIYTLRGGVVITCPSDLVKFEDEERSEEISEIIRNREVSSIEQSFDSMDADATAADMLSVANASVASVALCQQVIPLLQADDNLTVGFIGCAAELSGIGLGLCSAFETMKTMRRKNAVMTWAAENRSGLIALADYFADLISKDDGYADLDEETQKSIRMCVAHFELVATTLFSLKDFDKTDYALFHASASAVESAEDVVGSDSCIEWLAREFTKEEHAKERKIILCTNEPRTIAELKTEIPGVAILRADTLEMAKDLVNEPFDESEELERMKNSGESLPKAKKSEAAKRHYEEAKERAFQFEVGHPKSGVTYVQHPLAHNRYIDIQSYNTTLLERKYDELIEILTSIGATRISCSVENEQSRGGKMTRRRHVDGDVNTGVFGGVSGSYEGHKFSEKTTALNKRLACSITRQPNQHPCMPAKTLFYPFEERWQMMVKDVLSGQRTHEEVDLSYKREYSLSESETRKIAGKVESLIPAFQFGGSANYSDEYEAELKELESIVWHYEVDFGGAEAPLVNALPCKEEPPKVVQSEEVPRSAEAGGENKIEALFLKRARRYAKSDGKIGDEQRAELEAFAKKYGIDDFRMEELIEEAFEAM